MGLVAMTSDLKSNHKGYTILPAPVWPRQLPYVANYSVFKRVTRGRSWCTRAVLLGCFLGGNVWDAAEQAVRTFIGGLA